jgi:hypothetical protein
MELLTDVRIRDSVGEDKAKIVALLWRLSYLPI